MNIKKPALSANAPGLISNRLKLSHKNTFWLIFETRLTFKLGGIIYKR